MHPSTLMQISCAASLGSPSALNSLASSCLKFLTAPQLSPMASGTLAEIARASVSGHPAALDALVKDLFLEMSDCFFSSYMRQDTIKWLAKAAVCGRGQALEWIAPKLCRLSICHLSNMCPDTIYYLARASCKGYPAALSSITSIISGLSPESLRVMHVATIEALVESAYHQSDYSAVDNILPVFYQLDLDDQLRLDPSGSLLRICHGNSDHSTLSCSGNDVDSLSDLSIFSQSSQSSLSRKV